MLNQHRCDLSCSLVLGIYRKCVIELVGKSGQRGHGPRMAHSADAWNDSGHVPLQFREMERNILWCVDYHTDTT